MTVLVRRAPPPKACVHKKAHAWSKPWWVGKVPKDVDSVLSCVQACGGGLPLALSLPLQMMRGEQSTANGGEGGMALCLSKRDSGR